MKTIATVGAALLIALAGCGGDDEEEAAAPQKQETQPTKPVKVPADPYKINCGHLKDPVAAGRASRQASFTLADEAKIKDLSRLQAAQSIFFAMTELCKKESADYKPAKDAVAAVK